MRNKGMIQWRNVLLLGLTLLLSGCDMVMLDPKGMVAAAQKSLLLDSVGLMLLVVIPVILLSVFVVWAFRSGNVNAKYAPEWAHSTLLETIWWTIPCIIVGILAVMTWFTSHSLDPHRPLKDTGKPITVQVIALNWQWLFIYPEQKIASVNFLQMPVDVPVRFLITADAPMNSFQIPQLGGQIYAMPGMGTELNLIANALGDYRGMSANFSGDGFAGMNFIARASSQEDFDKWVASVKKTSKPLTIQAYKTLAKPTEEGPVQSYSAVADGLFDKVMMKYMQPGMEDLGEKDTSQTKDTVKDTTAATANEER